MWQGARGWGNNADVLVIWVQNEETMCCPNADVLVILMGVGVQNELKKSIGASPRPVMKWVRGPK